MNFYFSPFPLHEYTENKCLCPCLFSHLLYCWFNRKCNLGICRCSYFEPINTSFCMVFDILKVSSMCGILKPIWKIYCWYFPVRKVRIYSLETNFRLFHPDKLFTMEGTALSLTSIWQQQIEISRINNSFNLNKVH